MAADPIAVDAGQGWLERHTRISPVFQALMHVRVPMSAQTYYFGGIALFLFLIQAATGTLLTLYYKPTPEAAYESVQLITSEVSFGWLIRSLHHWAANLMILFVALHLGRVFIQAAFKHPRELTWVAGALLLMVTLGFGFTGYLLPWDQRAYWATVVGTEIAGSVPLVGEPLLLLLRGGTDVTGDTMSRFFGIHVLVLPLTMAALLAGHVILVHQFGLASRKHPEPRPPVATPAAATAQAGETAQAAAQPVETATTAQPDEKLRPFWPNYLVDELVAWYILLAVLVILASVWPAGLEGQANPLETPAHTKPEWYYLGVYELLKLVPRTIGILAPIVGIGVLVIWPFLETSPEIRMRRRKVAIGGFTVIVVGLIVLTVQGYVS